MNTRTVSMLVGLLLCLVTVLAAPQGAAAATAACTNIGNTATVNFNVGGAAQAAVSSPTNTIVVGNKVDHTVVTTNASAVSVVTSQTSSLTFTITNTGNAAQKYSLSYLASSGATSVFGSAVTDNFDATGVSTQVVSVVTTTTAPVLAGGSLTVTINGTMPGTLTENWLAVYALKAQAVNPITNVAETNASSDISVDGTTTACTSDIVLGDGAGTDDTTGARDGMHSARSAFIVHLTTLTVSKTSIVYWDPFNLFASPKAIPGAIMEYYVTITNSGGTSDAQNVAISDTLTGTLAPATPFTHAACVNCAGACIENPPATFTCNGSWAGQTLTATDPLLSSGATTTFRYRATIQ